MGLEQHLGNSRTFWPPAMIWLRLSIRWNMRATGLLRLKAFVYDPCLGGDVSEELTREFGSRKGTERFNRVSGNE